MRVTFYTESRQMRSKLDPSLSAWGEIVHGMQIEGQPVIYSRGKVRYGLEQQIYDLPDVLAKDVYGYYERRYEPDQPRGLVACHDLARVCLHLKEIEAGASPPIVSPTDKLIAHTDLVGGEVYGAVSESRHINHSIVALGAYAYAPEITSTLGVPGNGEEPWLMLTPAVLNMYRAIGFVLMSAENYIAGQSDED